MRGHSILPCSDTRLAWCIFLDPLRIPPGTAGLCSNCPGSGASWTLAKDVCLVRENCVSYPPSWETFDLVVNTNVVELFIEDVGLAGQRHDEAVQAVVVPDGR